MGTVLGVLLGALVAGLVPAAGDLAASVGDMLSVILGSLIDFLRLLVDPNTWSNVFGLWPRG